MSSMCAMSTFLSVGCENFKKLISPGNGERAPDRTLPVPDLQQRRFGLWHATPTQFPDAQSLAHRGGSHPLQAASTISVGHLWVCRCIHAGKWLRDSANVPQLDNAVMRSCQAEAKLCCEADNRRAVLGHGSTAAAQFLLLTRSPWLPTGELEQT